MRLNTSVWRSQNVAASNGSYQNITSGNVTPTNMDASVLQTGFTAPQYLSDYYVQNASFLRMDNITFGVIGGFTPLVAAWLVDRTGDEIAPAFLIMAAAAVTFLTVLRFRETYRSPFITASSGAAAAYARI